MKNWLINSAEIIIIVLIISAFAALIGGVGYSVYRTTIIPTLDPSCLEHCRPLMYGAKIDGECTCDTRYQFLEELE